MAKAQIQADQDWQTIVALIRLTGGSLGFYCLCICYATLLLGVNLVML